MSALPTITGSTARPKRTGTDRSIETAEAERQRARLKNLRTACRQLEAIAADQRVEAAKMEAQRVQMEEQERGRLQRLPDLSRRQRMRRMQSKLSVSQQRTIARRATYRTEAEKTDRVESTEYAVNR